MPKIADMFASYLRKEDLAEFGDKGKDVTIENVRQDSILSNGEELVKWFMDLKEFAHPLVLNKTNAEEVASVLGLPDSDDWTGKRINVFVDPSVKYKGKKVGGIKLRACAK